MANPTQEELSPTAGHPHQAALSARPDARVTLLTTSKAAGQTTRKTRGGRRGAARDARPASGTMRQRSGRGGRRKGGGGSLVNTPGRPWRSHSSGQQV